MDFVSKLSQVLEQFSFSHHGYTELTKPISIEPYRAWLKAGHHADMEYLERHLAFKENPSLFKPQARSAIVLAQPYFPHPYPIPLPSPHPTPPQVGQRNLSLRTALYAQGEDYHFCFKSELERLATLLKVDYPNEEFLCFTDSAPILERDLGVRAGLGWIGKNTCLIHPKKGSLFFIGEILTTLAPPALAQAQAQTQAQSQTQSAPKIPNFCGSCDRCIRACPTQALESPRVLNSRKCISYWTIEAKAVAPRELREKFADWFFGCDICQTVCPWNEKVFGKELMRDLSQPSASASASIVIEDLRWILNSSGKTLSKKLGTLPYSRARAQGLKRNALYVIGNQQIEELRAEVQALIDHPTLGVLAQWAFEKL